MKGGESRAKTVSSIWFGLSTICETSKDDVSLEPIYPKTRVAGQLFYFH
jgi:hypothetical protein